MERLGISFGSRSVGSRYVWARGEIFTATLLHLPVATQLRVCAPAAAEKHLRGLSGAAAIRFADAREVDLRETVALAAGEEAVLTVYRAAHIVCASGPETTLSLDTSGRSRRYGSVVASRDAAPRFDAADLEHLDSVEAAPRGLAWAATDRYVATMMRAAAGRTFAIGVARAVDFHAILLRGAATVRVHTPSHRYDLEWPPGFPLRFESGGVVEVVTTADSDLATVYTPLVEAVAG